MSEPSTSQQKAKEKVADPEPIEEHAHPDEEDHSGSDDDSEPDADGDPLGTAAGSSSTAVPMDTPGTAGKKKKKKRSKAAKALNALKSVGKGKDVLSDNVVKTVLEKVKAEGGEAVAGANEEMVRLALEQMKIRDVLQGKTGIGGKNKKDTGGHKVRVCLDNLLEIERS